MTAVVHRRVVSWSMGTINPPAVWLLLECDHKVPHDSELEVPAVVRCGQCEGVQRPRPRIISVPPGERRGPRRKP